ncbi:MAG: hypothetical protein IT318_27345 [Anaerolineales bacterium]|nr:hypothetical protein [Anaerolineales bacterium]
MKSIKVQMLAALLFGFAAALIAAGAVNAYSEKTWFTYSPQHKYDSSWPTGNDWQQRAIDSRTAWNNVSPTSFNWSYNASADSRVEYISLCCGRLGETGYWWCGVPYFSNICAAFPRIQNTGYTWYAGTGTPSSGQYDLWSVLTHEFGHGSGLYDHSTSGSCSGTGGPTMCPSISATSTHWRTLEQEDNDRLNSIYP